MLILRHSDWEVQNFKSAQKSIFKLYEKLTPDMKNAQQLKFGLKCEKSGVIFCARESKVENSCVQKTMPDFDNFKRNFRC